MSPAASDTLAEQVGRIADEFQDRLRRGETPTVEEYAAAHPPLAAVLRGVLPLICGTDPTPSTMPSAGPIPERLGEFRVLREVGRGGMGVVYEAVQEPLGRRVALKVLPAAVQLQPGYLERFRREAQAAARLHHTNIVPVFGVGEAGGVQYYAMQFIDGVSLDKAPLLQQGGFRSGARWGLQAAEALAYAHQQGVLHRDIKPANLLLDSAGTVWVADFGLAKLTDGDDLTGTGDFLGTLRYAAPECLRGPADERSDVYSLGATLYELLTGRPAFDAVERDRLVRQIAEEEPPRPRRLNSRIPRDLETVVLKALAKEPGRRYASAREFAEDLRRFIDGRPVAARRLSVVGHAARWCRRNQALAAVSAALLFAFIAGLSGVLWQWREASQQRDEAIEGRRLARANRAQAFAAAEQMLTRVGDWQLKDVPQMEQERRRLLEDALAFFQGFLHQDDQDPQTRLEVANAQLRVADIDQELGRYSDAESAYQQAISGHECLADQFPAEWTYRQNLAATLLNFGRFCRVARHDLQAEELLVRAANLLEDLTREQPDRAEPKAAYRDSLRALCAHFIQSHQFAKAEPVMDRYLALQEGLARERSASADEQVELARACPPAAEFEDARGKNQAAADCLRQAIDTLEPVVRDRPDRTQDTELLAMLHLNAGRARVKLAGQIASAEDAFGQSVRLWEQLARKHPFVPSYRLSLANARGLRADSLRLLNRTADAEDSYLKAVAELEPLTDQYPLRSEYRLGLYSTYLNLGILYQRAAGKPDAAEVFYRKALIITDGLSREQPESVEFAFSGLRTRNSLANLLRAIGRTDESIRLYDHSIAWLAPALARQPNDDSFRKALFVAGLGRGLSLMKLDRRAEANDEWRRVVELSEGRPDAVMQQYRAMPLAYLGEHARAAAGMEAVIAGQKPEPTVLFDFACAYGTAALAVAADAALPTPDREALAERYAARAVELLTIVEGTGYFAAPNRGVGWLRRWEFDRLAPRPDFQRVVAAVESKPSASIPEKK